MKKKNLKIEYIIIAVIIVASVLYLLFKGEDKIHYTIPVLNELKKENLNKIEINKDTERFFVERSGENWLIGDEKYPADKEKISKMADIISELKLTTLVSRSKNYFLYELGKEKGIEVIGYANGDIVRKFNIGKTASTYDHTFVKLDGDPNIYHAKDSIRNQFEKGIDDLRDKKIFSFEENSINMIDFTYNGNNISVTKGIIEEKKDNKGDSREKSSEPQKDNVIWKIGEKTVDIKDIKALLSGISDLECSKYIYDGGEELFSNDLITIKLQGAKQYQLDIFERPEKDKGDYSSRSSETKYGYYLSSYKVDSVTKALEKLYKPE
ncbi:MAG: DUF4340 domain-containing protein [Acidobacteriota bacterium]